MGKALELIAGDVTGAVAAGTFTGITMHGGNSLTVRNTAAEAKILLLTFWADVQVANSLRVRSPRLHDNVQGMRFETIASDLKPLLDPIHAQKLVPQDVLAVEFDESTAAADVQTFCALVYYDDLPGINGRFIGMEELKARMVNILTVENTIDSGAGGDWLGGEAINAEFDLLKANTDYALLGYMVSVECAAVRYRGSDIGNLGVGGPGTETERDLTSNWFIHLTERTGINLIPVFNSANKGAILVDVAQDENAGDPVVTTILAELMPAA